MNAAAKEMISVLGLRPLPHEGGYFRELGASEARLPNGRARFSYIWFLLTPDDFSALHRLKAEEDWQFQAGDPVAHVQLDAASRRERVTVLGSGAGQTRQVVVPGGVWQGARLMVTPQPCGWALLNCNVTPAWDEKEFELGSRAALLGEFPSATGWIEALTR